MEIELWKQSYRLPNNFFAMGPTIFKLWVMETENWVVEIACPNRLYTIKAATSVYYLQCPEFTASDRCHGIPNKSRAQQLIPVTRQQC